MINRPWCEKIRHKTKESADAHAARITAEDEWPFNRAESYPCSNCKGWHVGHRTPKWRRDLHRGALIATQKVLDRHGLTVDRKVLIELALVTGGFAAQGYRKGIKEQDESEE